MLGQVKHLQIIVHIMLINVFLVAHAEVFIQALLGIVSFELYDLTDVYLNVFSLEMTDPVNEHFENLDYESSDFILNMGLLWALVIILPVILIAILLFSRYCACLPKIAQKC